MGFVPNSQPRLSSVIHKTKPLSQHLSSLTKAELQRPQMSFETIDVGLAGFVRGGGSAPAFSADVPRIEVVVDLPGLVFMGNEEHDAHDIKVVEDLVDSYLQCSRTIILAVVQATNDIATHLIIQRARLSFG
ncbi:hypothetical protein AJ78_02578 [Emergomyces pasteurianus Ep9510]|uniref:Dynamin GTPase domain-containing protein n=1 Tax=Emergomyces pasteurianus Ep9510 TaxID=1447872 RepID=A0A1J9QNA3_9EURO|nr:hypothetical protein AJ78_02578 [Emergomyces pasteurianus Ep9510]